MTASARLNISLETDWQADAVIALADQVHSVKDLAASIASGSFRTDGMIVAPCSMKTLSAIVNSYADNLLTRAADVMLKERRRLVLMPRETPLHAGHCELLLKACQIGAIVAPPMPALYARPKTIDDMINHNVGRVLDLFDIESGLVKRWQGAAHAVRS
jgi:4-hydroxy-3-polyprenylbenzoate decarboxylase